MKSSVELLERTKALKAGDKLSMVERLSVIQDIREVIERSDVSVRDIADQYQVTYNTANEWRNQALLLMAKQDNGLTREALRNIGRGQIEYQIRLLTRELQLADDPELRLKYHDRLIKYRDQLHRITGLNSETVEHTVDMKPLAIHRAAMAIPSQEPVLEGEVTTTNN